MILEEYLLNYGVLGIWTIFNILTITYYRKHQEKQEDKLINVIENNTVAFTKVYEALKVLQKI